jgi:hypothetical protein
MTESVDGTRDKDHRPEEVDRAYNESKSSDAKKTQRDWTDNFGSITTFIASVIIGGAGVWSSHIYNSAQVEVKRLEIREEEERKDREEVRHSQVELPRHWTSTRTIFFRVTSRNDSSDIVCSHR